MCISLIAAAIGATATVASAVEQRHAAKAQASAIADQARQAAAQASETARGNALAAQTAAERAAALDQAKRNSELALSAQETPVVELATASPEESTRRRTVRASFNLDDDQASIRV